MSRIQSQNSWDVDKVSAYRCFLGLVTVDLALRLLALKWMTNFDVYTADTPEWSEENGIGKILRSLLSNAELTRDQLAARLGVSDTTVDNWLDGRHWPGREYVPALAKELALSDTWPVSSIESQLRRKFALGKICHFLSDAVGREYVLSAIDAVSRFARDLVTHVGPRFVPEKDRPAVAPMLLLAGSEFPLSPHMLRFLASGYPDGGWRDVILVAAVPWEVAFGLAMKTKGGSMSFAAGLAQDYMEVVDESGRASAVAAREAIAASLMTQTDAFVPRGPLPIPEHHPLSVLQEGIELRRQLAERFPDNPEAHFQLGSFLGMAGKWTGVRDFIDQGLVECRIASGLAPDWDVPSVERGIMLTNFDAHQEALRELEQVTREGRSLTPHFRFAMGYVLTELRRFAEGLQYLEEVIQVRPDYALAYRYAAHCAFMVGNRTKGLHFAKTARRLGDSTEFDAWKRGEYNPQRRDASPRR